MSESTAQPFREVAWNGIRFLAPAEWQPEKIGRNYLLLEEEGRPVMEVKWAGIKGRFSEKAHLKRLVRAQQGFFRKSIKRQDVPESWAEALAGRKTSGFRWGEEGAGGRGAMIFCPECQCATLIQFFQYDKEPDEAVPERVLSSFCDHRDDDATLWAVFDIRAEIGSSLRLISHRFSPGRFELTFASKKETVTLYRWSPASMILKNRDLSEFAAELGPPDVPPDDWEHDGESGVIWEGPFPNSRWSKWKYSLKPGWKPWGVRVWHVKDKNRLLGVKVSAKSPLFPGYTGMIGVGYQAV